MKNYWSDGYGGATDAVGEIVNVRLYGKNKTPIADSASDSLKSVLDALKKREKYLLDQYKN